MALIKCPECQQDISDKAMFCPHCGFSFPEGDDSAAVEKETPTVGGAAFSTRDRYKKQYTTIAVVYSVVYILGVVSFTILGVGIGGAIWALLVWLCCRKWLQQNKSLAQSYVELHDDRICGVTTMVDTAVEAGISFTAEYQNITHIDDISNKIAVIHTTHGDYSVQAYECAHQVRELIRQKQQQLNAADAPAEGE